MKLSFLKSKKLNPSANSDMNRVLRQQYALAMLRLLYKGRRVINIDETWLNETSYIRRAWSERDGRQNAPLNVISHRVSMIAALDTDGHFWFALSQAKTNSNMIALFLSSLKRALDTETPGWEENSYVLWDNASYHGSEDTRAIT